MDIDAVLGGVRARSPRALARALSIVEAGGPSGEALLRHLDRTGHALTVGITGPPGAGKSTLVDRLVARLRADGRTVGVLAVDPSSARTGGALLGDRVRMQAHAADAGVFIRSMATRGHLGGLAGATRDAARVLDAAGFDVVLIETVGVGQDETDIVTAADLVVLVLVPGLGDEVQASKAGIMEIADLFVVNKADREDADATVSSIRAALAIGGAERPTPIIRTVASTGSGIDEVLAAIERFRHDRAAEIIRRRTERAAWPKSGTSAAPSVTIDHVAIACADAAEVMRFLRERLGLAIDAPEEIESQQVRVRFAGEVARLELVEPLARGDATSPLARFLASRGPGLHHVALRVADLDRTLAVLADAGVRLIDRAARPGAHGTRVAFVHPSSTGGVLVELVEGAGEAARASG